MLCKGDVNITISNAITDWNNLTYFIHEVSNKINVIVYRPRLPNYYVEYTFQNIRLSKE